MLRSLQITVRANCVAKKKQLEMGKECKQTSRGSEKGGGGRRQICTHFSIHKNPGAGLSDHDQHSGLNKTQQRSRPHKAATTDKIGKGLLIEATLLLLSFKPLQV